MREPGAILLVACYELGHQPLAVAWPAAFLERRGYAPALMDVSVEPFDPERVRQARLVAISVPMHTALRLGVNVARRAREVNPGCHVCFFGLYAALNAEWLLAHGADSVLAGELEDALVDLVERLDARASPSGEGGAGDAPDGARREDGSGREPGGEPGDPLASIRGEAAKHVGFQSTPSDSRIARLTPRLPAAPVLEKLNFPVPSRAGLPPLKRYAHLEHEGRLELVGYVEASRGCKHHCRHCPIPPVYGGRFFVVPPSVVLADVRQLVESGARHITFGDPDFLNGPGHALRVARGLHAAVPDVTFDFTAKVEHLLRHRDVLPELRGLGCLFIVSAVESLSDTVLAHLDKGHTRADVLALLDVARAAGITLRPTWVPFTPWTTLEDYREILDVVEREGLVDHVDPVQYSIRLLVPPGSLLLDSPTLRPHLGRLVEGGFYYQWRHPDPRLDFLQEAVARLVAEAADRREDAAATFARVAALAAETAGVTVPAPATPEPDRRRPPRLTEAWFC
jgi:radical SAM superfamily enzyme YgiQ (UPF0313 family)